MDVTVEERIRQPPNGAAASRVRMNSLFAGKNKERGTCDGVYRLEPPAAQGSARGFADFSLAGRCCDIEEPHTHVCNETPYRLRA